MCYQVDVYVTGPCENTSFDHRAWMAVKEYRCEGGNPPRIVHHNGPYGCYRQLPGQPPEAYFSDCRLERRRGMVPREYCIAVPCLHETPAEYQQHQEAAESMVQLAQQPAREIETIDDFYEEGDYVGLDDSLYPQRRENHHHETEPVGEFNEDAFDFIGPEDGPTHDDMLEYEDEEMYEGVTDDEHEQYVHDGQERMAAEGLLSLSRESVVEVNLDYH